MTRTFLEDQPLTCVHVDFSDTFASSAGAAYPEGCPPTGAFGGAYPPEGCPPAGAFGGAYPPEGCPPAGAFGGAYPPEGCPPPGAQHPPGGGRPEATKN
ncbi:hypothetical protein COOONC_04538 [Cooperia oncophora]